MNTDKVGSFKQDDGIQDAWADAGQIIGLGFYFSGTNNSGQTGAFSDLGRTLTERNGSQKDNIAFNDIKRVMNTRGGVAMLDSTTGGDFEAYVMIPFFSESVASALNIIGNEEFNVEWQPGDDGTVFSDLSVSVWARTASFPELGKLNWVRRDETYAGEKTADQVRLKYDNIQDIYVDDVDDVLTLIELSNNNGSIQDAAPYGVLRGYTLQENNVEDETFDLARVNVNTPGSIDYNNGTAATVSVSGAGDVGFIVAHWEDS